MAQSRRFSAPAMGAHRKVSNGPQAGIRGGEAADWDA
jgi:hypothetical protein